MTALALLSLLVLSSVSWTGTDATFPIPDISRPISYELHLHPNIAEDEFHGRVTIDFIMKQTSSVLVLHQKHLHIKDIELIGTPITEIKIDHELDILIIYSRQELVIGNTYRVKIMFSGMMDDTGDGFYLSRYVVGNETKFIATTHLEATNARRVFPCWDEPMYKATFDISITHLKNYTAVLSNMPVLNKTDNGNTFTTYFQRTKQMPTYLVAFIVSDYSYKSDPTNQFRIYTKSDSVQHTRYALKFSIKAMDQLDQYTALPYFKTMPKMDQVTIMDFNPSAMENWGLVTYRENNLFYEEDVTPNSVKENIAKTITHEFVHQWFGNLVSPRWWEFVWLNEGFATYLQYYITDQLEPTWRLAELFAVEMMQWGAFIMDGKLNSRPMNKDVNTPSEINQLFDGVAYHKAASVIRMFSHILTEEVFQTALRIYLSENAYKTTDSDNLIGHFQDVAGTHKLWGGATISQIAETWFTQSGYPVVTVKKTSPGHYSLSQTRFLYYQKANESKWWIPISYVTNNDLNFADTTPTHWMNPKENNLIISETKADWILVNKQQTGYYRVNYDDEIWQSLSKYLKSNMHQIHPVNRAQLIDDSLQLARKNLTKYETALSLTLYLTHEIDYIPWMTTFKNLDFLRNLIFPSSHYHIFKHYVRYVMVSLTKNMTYEAFSEDDHPTKILKGLMTKWACLADAKECVDHAHKEFNAWIKDPHDLLDADMKEAIICTGLRTASEAVWDHVLQILAESIYDIDAKTSPLEVMACSNNRTILEKFLMISAKPDTKIKFEYAVRSVIANTNVSGVEIVLKLFENAQAGEVHLPVVGDLIRRSVNTIAAGIVDKNHYMRLCDLMIWQEAPDDIVEKTLIRATRNLEWVTTYRHIVDEWLANNEKLFNSSGTTLSFTAFLLIFSIFNTLLLKILF